MPRVLERSLAAYMRTRPASWQEALDMTSLLFNELATGYNAHRAGREARHQRVGVAVGRDQHARGPHRAAGRDQPVAAVRAPLPGEHGRARRARRRRRR